jgi:hypothetical protein
MQVESNKNKLEVGIKINKSSFDSRKFGGRVEVSLRYSFHPKFLESSFG